MVGDDQRPPARHLAVHADVQIVRPRDRAERTGEPVGGRTRVPRRRHPRRAELGERVEQPATEVLAGVQERSHAATAVLGSRPSRSYLGRSFSNCARSIFDTIRSSPGP